MHRCRIQHFLECWPICFRPALLVNVLHGDLPPLRFSELPKLEELYFRVLLTLRNLGRYPSVNYTFHGSYCTTDNCLWYRFTTVPRHCVLRVQTARSTQRFLVRRIALCVPGANASSLGISDAEVYYRRSRQP